MIPASTSSGGSLRDRQRLASDGRLIPLPLETLADWLPGVAAALDFIHERHHIYRDLKPDNILFDENGHAYLRGFGTAKVFPDDVQPSSSRISRMEASNVGTARYMAPECVLGEPYDGRSDQFALAITVYELLGGRLPFEGPTQ